MKKIFLALIVVGILFISAPVWSQQATTNDGYFACISESDVDDMVKFAVAKDMDSFQAYIDKKRCIMLKSDLNVTVMKSSGFLGAVVQFAYKGLKLWTLREALTNYR